MHIRVKFVAKYFCGNSLMFEHRCGVNLWSCSFVFSFIGDLFFSLIFPSVMINILKKTSEEVLITVIKI